MTTADLISYASLSASTLTVLLIAYGLSQRKHAKRHMKVMVSCFILDLTNLIFIEATRLLGLAGQEVAGGGEAGAGAGGAEGGAVVDGGGLGKGAVEKSLESLSDGDFTLLDFHILISVVMMAGYVVAIVTGRRLHKTGDWRSIHKANAALFILMRLANYVTSFMI